MKKKAWLVRTFMALTLAASAAQAFAQDAVADRASRTLRRRVSLLAQQGPELYGKIWDARARTPLLFGIAGRRSSQPTLFEAMQQVAKVFMDDVKVATVGDWQIKLKVEFK